jgi:hypothetical protein
MIHRTIFSIGTNQFLIGMTFDTSGITRPIDSNAQNPDMPTLLRYLKSLGDYEVA